MTTIDLLCWRPPDEPWIHGEVVVIPNSPSAAAPVVERVMSTSPADWLLFWDTRSACPAQDIVEELVAGRADAWHNGIEMGQGGLPEEHDYVHPTWPLALDPAPGVEGASWRASLRGMLVRRSALQSVGGLDPGFDGWAGCGLELGRRLIDRGAVIFATPRLSGDGPVARDALSEHDRFLWLRRVFTRKWVRYAAVRRAAATRRPDRVVRAMRSSGRTCSDVRRPGAGGAVVTRDPVGLPDDPQVSVVLPTLGRYELLRPLLEQLRAQTIRPIQVIVVDQNDPERRDHDLYAEFADLALEVIFQDERGQWLARNAAIRASTGEWITFLDDDSEIGPDFIAQHLEGLLRYRADLSTGASNAVVGAPVPENYAFFRVADQWDSGNGLCHRSLFERLGLFDQQFDRQRRGDAEFGLRTQLHGGLVIHNPHAVRVHLKAADGGLRTFGSWDGFRHRDRDSPLPLPSIVYYAKRFHSARQVREDLVIGLSQAIVPYHLKRRASPMQWVGFVAAELLHVPSTVRRIRTSLRLADQMLADGPKIPLL